MRFVNDTCDSLLYSLQIKTLLQPWLSNMLEWTI